MRISKILNNNSAVVTDERGNEKVVVGKGICFRKKVGDQMNMSAVEKTFQLSSTTLNLRFQEVLVSLPLEQISVVEKIVDETKLSLGKKISDSIYVSLADHIHFSLLNHEKGISVKNRILLDIKRFYWDEYKIGRKALEIIKEETGVMLSDDEAGFIALHIVNAETEDDYIGTKNIYKATKIIEEVLNIVKSHFGVEIDEGSLIYYRFIVHLRYFAQRILNNTVFHGDDKDKELLGILALNYSQAYQCSLEISEFIEKKYGAKIGCEEILYMTIHVQRAVFEE